ncbi:UrcA family protein [Pseudohalioglobus sediminis]|uniref:UrcA family protein n=1 Tax=Pseudohalioglobus sediminis TaxID=2606449 RepID=A0A5B0WVY5_9GAMM|nr:UrcA family protein [Pseudohalioglobus sediminis]KAA1190558.1 UrcA family protein [Pseudohalioglobus sediminis]
MKNIMIKSVLTASVLTMAAAAPLHASADGLTETIVRSKALPSAAVTFHRSELATVDGRRAVVKRVERAAEQVCGDLDYRKLGSLRRAADNRECYDRAVAQAMGQIESAQVASID